MEKKRLKLSQREMVYLNDFEYSETIYESRVIFSFSVTILGIYTFKYNDAHCSPWFKSYYKIKSLKQNPEVTFNQKEELVCFLYVIFIIFMG